MGILFPDLPHGGAKEHEPLKELSGNTVQMNVLKLPPHSPLPVL